MRSTKKEHKSLNEMQKKHNEAKTRIHTAKEQCITGINILFFGIHIMKKKCSIDTREPESKNF